MATTILRFFEHELADVSQPYNWCAAHPLLPLFRELTFDPSMVIK